MTGENKFFTKYLLLKGGQAKNAREALNPIE